MEYFFFKPKRVYLMKSKRLFNYKASLSRVSLWIKNYIITHDSKLNALRITPDFYHAGCVKILIKNCACPGLAADCTWCFTWRVAKFLTREPRVTIIIKKNYIYNKLVLYFTIFIKLNWLAFYCIKLKLNLKYIEIE